MLQQSQFRKSVSLPGPGMYTHKGIGLLGKWMGTEEIIFCKGLQSCHLGLRFAASKGGCFIWKRKIREFRWERKTRYEGKISASESKGFLQRQCLRKRGKEAVIFAGNRVLGRAGEGIICCKGEKVKPSLIPLYLVSVSRWQTAGAGSCLQHAALDQARRWRTLWSCPTLGLRPTIVVPGLKCFRSYLKLTFVQTFCYLRSCEGVPRRWCVLQACRCHAALRFLSSGVFLVAQVMLMPSDLITWWVTASLCPCCWVIAKFLGSQTAFFHIEVIQCELWWEEAAQHTSEGTAEMWTYWFGSQKLELINVRNNGRNWVLRSTSNSFSRRVCQTLLLRENMDLLAFSSRFLTVTRMKQEWRGKMRHVFWKNIQAD